MNSVGVFREGEIDGNKFFVFTFLSQKYISSSSFSSESVIDSGKDLSLQSLFLCPSCHLKSLKQKAEEIYLDYSFAPLDFFPQFLHQQTEKMLHSNDCKVPLLPLFWCNNKEPSVDEFFCRACGSIELGTNYYVCVTCNDIFHKKCVESPFVIKHPSYPSLSIRPYISPNSILECVSCRSHIIDMGYHCPTNKLTLHTLCVMKPVPIVIYHPKRHPHSLTFFPKQAFLPCNVCGLIKKIIPTYVCLQCVFVVHQDCVYFPCVIRISRHHGRIYFTYFLPSGKWSCGVCRQKIDNDYGAYSCNTCGDYFVHSRCALREDLWDGKELDGIHEECEVVVEPFERSADGTINHLSHHHRLKLEISRVYDKYKFCQACVLPIYEGNYYSCVYQYCDFILHETCANAPLEKHHPLHARSLTLKFGANEYMIDGDFRCCACQRENYGFFYEDPKGNFKLDLICASVHEPFKYEGHEHPLYLALSPEDQESALCQICQDEGDKTNYCSKLNCIECNFVVCFKCITLPYKAKYKHDKHFLTFYEAKEANNHSDWCDVCERKIVDTTKKGFYSCDECCTTLHIDCLLGENIYIKPGCTIESYYHDYHIYGNNSLSPPFCFVCDRRCRDKVVFKYKIKSFCSVSCVRSFEKNISTS